MLIVSYAGITTLVLGATILLNLLGADSFATVRQKIGTSARAAAICAIFGLLFALVARHFLKSSAAMGIGAAIGTALAG